MLSKLILTAKIMRKLSFKIQMLAGNSLKICVSASFEISLILEVADYYTGFWPISLTLLYARSFLKFSNDFFSHEIELLLVFPIESSVSMMFGCSLS